MFWAALGLHHSVVCHGCQLGWKSIVAKTFGKPLKKPLQLASNDQAVLDLFKDCLCKGCDHAPTAGADTKNSEKYPPEFARLVHHAFEKWVGRAATPNNVQGRDSPHVTSTGWYPLEESVNCPSAPALTWDTVPDAKRVEQILLEVMMNGA